MILPKSVEYYYKTTTYTMDYGSLATLQSLQLTLEKH